MNHNDNHHRPTQQYQFNQFAIFKARNGMRAQILHYFLDEPKQFLVRYDDGQLLRLNDKLRYPESNNFDIIGTYPFSAINAVSTEEIVDLIGNYALINDPQKREQIRAVIIRHAADFVQKPWFPKPQSDG